MVGHTGLSPPRCSFIADSLLSILFPETPLLLIIQERVGRDIGLFKGTFIPSVDMHKTNHRNQYPAVLSFSLLQWLDGFEMAEV